MAHLEIAPRYRALLRQAGRALPDDFLEWAGVILSGHPSRHVLRVRVGTESFILKKEHSVPWRDRLASTWEGHGWSSKSVREARVLAQLREAGVACPEVVAYGEVGKRAFLLLRDEKEMCDLRVLLGQSLAGSTRREVALALGRELARIHDSGFVQPDLYAKHVLIARELDGWRFCFLDWQRSSRHARVSWKSRLRDLAALDASLADALASDSLRLACLRAYLYASRATLPLRRAALAVREMRDRLLTRRKVRELRQPPLPAGAQQLLWLEGDERLCVARDFLEERKGRLPACVWLPPPSPEGDSVETRKVTLPNGRIAWCIRRFRTVAASWPRHEKFPAPEFARVSMLFRLERFGVQGPRVLAMGHQPVGPTLHYSFLLSEPPVAAPLEHFLRARSLAERRACLAQAGRTLRRIHEAGYRLRLPEAVPHFWGVSETDGSVVLGAVEHLEATLEPWIKLARLDLPRLYAVVSNVLPSPDALRFLRGYLQPDERREYRALAALLTRREREAA